MEENCGNVFQVTIPAMTMRNLGNLRKDSARICDIPTEIRTRGLQNISRKHGQMYQLANYRQDCQL